MDRFPTPSGLTPRRDETQPPFPPKTDNLLERKWEGPNVKGGWGIFYPAVHRLLLRSDLMISSGVRAVVPVIF
jgi:hypothetical protein